MKNPYKSLADKDDSFEVDMSSPVAVLPPYAPPVPQMIGAVPIPITEDGVNYKLTTELGTAVLQRGVDFGKLPKMNKPSLFKAGAEKIATQLGLLQHYTIESVEERLTDKPAYCFYRVRCDLDKIGPNGMTYTICTGYGSANTLEKRNGQLDVWNAANATLKMATKRALVAAALSVSSASGLFSQDLEDSDFNDDGNAALKQTMRPDNPLTLQQRNHIVALAAKRGITARQTADFLKEHGYNDLKSARQKDYAALCALFQGEDETNG